MNRQKLQEMPKIELHCHLDGSLPAGFVNAELGRTVDPSELKVSRDCRDLNEYLTKFDLPISCLRTGEQVEEAGYELLLAAAEENVRYIEVRYAPTFLATENFSAEDSVRALIRGIRRAEKEQPIHGNVILCAMRNLTPEQNLQVLDLTEKYLGQGVVCMDLAGAEALYPTQSFEPLFREASSRGVPFIIHAGETGDPDSARSALKFGARRIGHGIAMRGQEDLKNFCREHRIGIEMCPTSNLQTRGYTESMGTYPLREFLDSGLLASVNTDNRTVSGTTLTEELELAAELCDLTDQELIQIERNALETSFAPNEVKKEIRAELDGMNLC